MLDWIQSGINLIGKGGLIMVPILLCSIIALAIVIERLIFTKKTQVDPEQTLKLFQGFLESGRLPNELRPNPNNRDSLTRMIAEGLRLKDLPKWKLEENLLEVGQEELNQHNKYIRGLEVIAAITPLLGLLGTVIGMVQAFNKVAEHKGIVDPSLLAGGIWEALLTTAAGLSVAIPTMVMLHYFNRRTDKTTFYLEKCGRMIVHHFSGEKKQNPPSKNWTDDLIQEEAIGN